MFAVSLVAAIVAIVAWTQRDDGATAAPTTSLTVPDLSSLAGDAPAPEDLAPDFEVPLFAGETFSLADHLRDDGRPVFLNMWASWCFPCRAEMPTIDEAAQRHPDVLFISVAVDDSLNDARQFYDEIGLTYPIGFDAGDVVRDRYPILGMPATFLILPSGEIANRVFGQVTAEQIDQELAEAFGT